MQCAPYITAMVMGVPMIKKMISIVSLFLNVDAMLVHLLFTTKHFMKKVAIFL
jgi:hypothetical protein